MLSGIGDAEYLSSMGIKTIVDLPAVGKNLHVSAQYCLLFQWLPMIFNLAIQDHAYLAFSWSVNSNDTLDDLHRNATLAEEFLALWKINGTGPLGTGSASMFGWLRIPDSTRFFKSQGVPDPSAGPTSAHVEFILSVRRISLHGSTNN